MSVPKRCQESVPVALPTCRSSIRMEYSMPWDSRKAFTDCTLTAGILTSTGRARAEGLIQKSSCREKGKWVWFGLVWGSHRSYRALEMRISPWNAPFSVASPQPCLTSGDKLNQITNTKGLEAVFSLVSRLWSQKQEEIFIVSDDYFIILPFTRNNFKKNSIFQS